MKCIDLSGSWSCEIPGERTSVRLPGTLEESDIGFPDDPAGQWQRGNAERIGFWQPGDPIVTRLTRRKTFEGSAKLFRRVDWPIPANQRVFVDVERARQLRLLVNGEEAPPYRPVNLVTPCTFEVTGFVNGSDQFVFLSDNSYSGWPREAIVYSSAASDETQTNWNGLLGYIRIRTEAQVFFSDVRVYPRGEQLRVFVEMDAAYAWMGDVHFSGDALEHESAHSLTTPAGQRQFCFDLKLKKDVPRWDIEDGKLSCLTVSAPGLESRTVHFGVRDFRAGNGRFLLNDRRIFLRGEANCAVFPETGYCPMDTEAWKEILLKYRAYGVNCMRFHSHCPPEAAFNAADELGMLMQPELSCWDPAHAFETGEARRYYRDECSELLRHLANHPSFVMLTLGNELQADAAGHAFMKELLQNARQYDPTRLYAKGSNIHYGERGADPADDFYTAMRCGGLDLRATCDGPAGWLNHAYPDACRDYGGPADEIRRASNQPVFSFEVGQYEVLPDFAEIDEYHGITSPENLKHIRKKVREKGLEKDWARRVEATGESSLLCYRAEVEAALRTAEMSGISLLGLQDFPGQGTALVGMLNAHLQPKAGGFARPERFAAFFRDTLPLVLLRKYTYTAGETLTAEIRMANYGKRDLSGALTWEIAGEGFHQRGEMPKTTAYAGGLTDLGEISISLREIEKPTRLTLTAVFGGTRNTYPLWVYPDVRPVCPASVYECRAFDERAEGVLQNGGIVYLAPDSREGAVPQSVPAQFSPDFWSVCTFPHQAGSMGQLIDVKHPIFRNFPTEAWNTWQWWPMANQRAMLMPERIGCIVEEMDSFALLRPMAKLFECRCGRGRLLVSSLNLHHLQQYPEARALQCAIYAYLSSEDFAPGQTVSPDWIRRIFEKKTEKGR